MAQCKLTPHEFIQNAFSPMVAVMCSPLVDQICQKNNLSFIELLQPFCKLNSEAHIRDPTGMLVPVRNLRITVLDVNSRPPQPTLARKFLNESVSMTTSERNTTLQIGSQTIDVPASVPWFEAWRETFLQVQFPSDHEFTKHYLGCVLAVSSAESNPTEVLHHMGQQLQQLQNTTPAKLPKWFSPTILHYHVLVHDSVDGDGTKAESVFSTMVSTYGDVHCYYLQINSRPHGHTEDNNHLPDPWSQYLIRHFDNQESSDQGSSPRTPAEVGSVTGMPSRVLPDGETDVVEVGQVAQEAVAVTQHPLSPDADSSHRGQTHDAPNHINANVWAGQSTALTAIHGACLTSTDLDHVRGLVQELCSKALLPFVERQIQQLTDIISNKKGVSRSLFSATKRWFGSNKPGLPGSNTPVNAVIYSSDAPELQLRRLGDLCFMFGHYSLAFQAYHSAKRDFSADQAWLYYAGALEMASLSAFMQGEVTRKAQEYMEEAIVTYLNSCKMPQFATRATLLSTECLKGRSLYGEAAKQFIRMTSEDSDLRSALLLEQASYCFLKATRPRMTRKYAFHIVLAGHRFSKAGQRKHSLRCYRQAFQVYENKCWSLAEDHIHFTIGRQATNLKQVSEAAQAFARLLSPASRQSATQQAAFLKEFLATQQQLNAEGINGTALPVLPLPVVDSNAIRVLIGHLPPPASFDGETPIIPATGVTFTDDFESANWSKLEEAVLTEAQGSPPMIFKPTVQLYTNRTTNTNKPTAVVGEPVSVNLQLLNPLHISLPLRDVRLLWTFRSSGEVVSQADNEIRSPVADNLVLTQCVESLVLKPDMAEEVTLQVTPNTVGELDITGLVFRLASLHPDSAAAGSNNILVPGKLTFNVKGPRLKSTKEKPSHDAKDQRLELKIVPSAPCLQVCFRGLSSEMLCGEMQQVTLELKNVGNATLTNLLVGSTTPELFSLGSKTGTTVTKVMGSTTLAPGQAYQTPMWLRAPDNKGNTTLVMLFYYENINSSAIPRYRVVRHSWQLSVINAIQASVTGARSGMSSHHSAQTINFTMSVKNCNQVRDPLMTEVSLVQLSLVSSMWQLSKEVVAPASMKLQAQEVVHIVFKASRSTKEDQGTMYSDVLLCGDSNSDVRQIRDSPYIDFCQRFAAKTVNIEGENPGAIRNEVVEKMEAALRLDATVVVHWKAQVTGGRGRQRWAHGQHHISVSQLGETATWPPDLPQAPPELAGPLVIFGRDVPHTASLYPSLDTLSRLVTYNVHHSPHVTHDFALSRLCVVPTQLVLQNCCNSHILVKVNTLGSNSSTGPNKNQLYSPQSSTDFRWVGLAESTVEMSPCASVTLSMAAAIGAPGTYNLGARLEVWVRQKGAPKADAVAQSWHIESSAIVSS